jgi:hypothetical protein
MRRRILRCAWCREPLPPDRLEAAFCSDAHSRAHQLSVIDAVWPVNDESGPYPKVGATS